MEKLIAFIIVLIIVFGAVSIPVIWALNNLFNTGIGYTISNMISVTILVALIKIEGE